MVAKGIVADVLVGASCIACTSILIGLLFLTLGLFNVAHTFVLVGGIMFLAGILVVAFVGVTMKIMGCSETPNIDEEGLPLTAVRSSTT